MVSRVKTWFLAPSWDLGPDSVELGSIIKYPMGPIKKEYALYRPSNADIDSTIYITPPKENFSFTIEQSKKRKAGMLALFLEAILLRAGAENDEQVVENYHAEQLTSKWFVPSQSFEQKATEAVNVRNFLERTGFKEPVYMITGIRIAKGTTVTTKAIRGRSVAGWGSLDFSPASAPAKVEGGAQDKASEKMVATFTQQAEMVFAYQLRKLQWVKDAAVSDEFVSDDALLELNEDMETMVSTDVDGSRMRGIEATDELDDSDWALLLVVRNRLCEMRTTSE